MHHRNKPLQPEPNKRRPWWREPMMWLVVGGPLAVVLASLLSAVLAFRGADPIVVDRAGAASIRDTRPSAPR
jgi:uncharacterized protein